MQDPEVSLILVAETLRTEGRQEESAMSRWKVDIEKLMTTGTIAGDPRSKGLVCRRIQINYA
jgi:hypothetical protein